MDWYSATKILFFLLFHLKDIFSTHALSLENDITKPIDKWIAKIFTIDAKTACNLFATITDYKLKEYEHNLTQKLNPFQTKIFLQNVNFKTRSQSGEDSNESSKPVKLDSSDTPHTPEIYWKFSENKIKIFFDELFLEAKGTLSAKKNEPYVEFHTYLGLMNASLTAVASPLPTNSNRLKISQNFTYIDFINSYDETEDIHWTNIGMLSSLQKHSFDSNPANDYYEPDYARLEHIDNNSTNEEPQPVSSNEQKEELAREITPVLPSLVRENLYHNEEFIYEVKEIFNSYIQPKKEIISKHPDFLANPQQYHYLIPKINYLSFTLKRIVIGGLSNLDSFKVHKASGIFTHTLLIKNVEGSMTLEYGTPNESPLKMNFHVDCLYVSKKQDTNCVYVQAQYYQIFRAKANTPLNSRQSEAMVHGLEAAIASSILPWVEVGKVCDLESPLEEIKIANASDWKTVKESYRGWIPFNDDVDNTAAANPDGAQFPFNVFQH